MSETACGICGGPSAPFGEKSGWPLGRCRICGQVSALRMPSAVELSEHYRRYAYDTLDFHHIPPFVRSRLREVAASFSRYRKSNRLLDVGFGAGAMLEAARLEGWDPFGTEVSTLAVEQARKLGFTNVHEGDFLEAPYRAASFDVVVATELLEHLPDPLPFIRQARRLLAPGGAFYLTTPNANGISGRLLGLDWSIVAPPEHINLFSPRSLRLALESCGFEVSKIRCEGVNPDELLRYFRGSRRHGSNSDGPQFDRTGSSYALNGRLSANPAGRALKTAANAFLTAMRMGDSLKALAVKPG